MTQLELPLHMIGVLLIWSKEFACDLYITHNSG